MDLTPVAPSPVTVQVMTTPMGYGYYSPSSYAYTPTSPAYEGKDTSGYNYSPVKRPAYDVEEDDSCDMLQCPNGCEEYVCLGCVRKLPNGTEYKCQKCKGVIVCV